MDRFNNFIIDENGEIWYCGPKLCSEIKVRRTKCINKFEKVKIDENYKNTIFKTFDCGIDFVTFIDDKQQIWVIGDNNSGQLGLRSDNTKIKFLTPIISNNGYIFASCGKDYSVLVTINDCGDVLSCGEIGVKYELTSLANDVNMVYLSQDFGYIAGLDCYGNIWGKNMFCVDETFKMIQEGQFVNVVVGINSIFALSIDGVIYEYNTKLSKKKRGQLEKEKFKLIPVNTEILKQNSLKFLNKKNNVYDVKSYPTFFSLIRHYECNLFALDSEGFLWVYCSDYCGQLPLEYLEASMCLECLVKLDYKITFIDIQPGFLCTALLDTNGNIWFYGDTKNHGRSNTLMMCRTNSPVFFVEIKCLDGSILGLDSEGYMYSFGSNKYGQLGLGDYKNRDILTQVDIPVRVSSINGKCKKYNNIKSSN